MNTTKPFNRTQHSNRDEMKKAILKSALKGQLSSQQASLPKVKIQKVVPRCHRLKGPGVHLSPTTHQKVQGEPYREDSEENLNIQIDACQKSQSLKQVSLKYDHGTI